MHLQHNISLKRLTTFGVEARTRFFIETESPRDISFLLMFRRQNKYPLFILGGGSNILFTHDWPGAVIRINSRGIEKKREDREFVYVTAEAGEPWDNFVRYCVEKGWGGVENLSLIPGTVGAAPIQNIGAYGVEMKDVVEEVHAVSMETGQEVWLSADQCGLGYRESIFKKEWKGKYIVMDVTFRLHKISNNYPLKLDYGTIREELASAGVSSPGIRDVRDAVIRIRSAKLPDPKIIGNAGSFFKNPVVPAPLKDSLAGSFPGMPAWPSGDGFKISAAWLIEQCGWKGKRIGDAGVHERQPLVLVNHGNATGQDIISLAAEVQASVREKFGIDLTPEVNIL